MVSVRSALRAVFAACVLLSAGVVVSGHVTHSPAGTTPRAGPTGPDAVNRSSPQPSTSGLTVVTTDSNRPGLGLTNGSRAEAEIVAYDRNGSVRYYNDTYDRYWDVDPVVETQTNGMDGNETPETGSMYTATHRESRLARVVTSLIHFGFSIPNFLLAEVLLLFVLGRSELLAGLGPGTYSLLRSVVIPAAIVGTSLLAGQMRYARAQSLEYANTEFVKLVRAKGAGTRRVARHLLRNAAIPLLALFFTDMIGILVVNVFVIEYVFSIPGIGGLSLVAFQQQDLPVVLGATMVIVFVGIGGNFLQDVAYLVLDPRVEE